MDYKKSIFNFTYKRAEDEYVVYNTFSKSLIMFNECEFQKFQNDIFDDKKNKETLFENGLLVENECDEIAFLKYFHYKTKFANDSLFLTIAPTLDCNFACPYCYENRRHGKMTEEVQNAVISFIEKKVSEGIEFMEITWYGGEPLLCMDVVENISRHILSIVSGTKCKLKMHMVTNGYLLDEELIELLDEIGITKIQITIDGLAECHNVRRPLKGGQGTFDKLIENLKLFDDSPIQVLVRMNVDNMNCKDFGPLRKIVDDIGNPNIRVYASPVEDLNKDTVNDVSDFMTTEEFDQFTMNACDEGEMSSDDFSVMDNRYCFCTAETENCYVVDEVGDFYKCWDEVGRKEYRCFNILEDDSVNYYEIAKFLTDDPFSDDKCKNCVFLPVCFGGCKFQKAHLKKSVCGFTDETMKKYIETNLLKEN